MITKVKLDSKMTKYNSVKLRHIGHNNVIIIPKDPATNRIKSYTPYISSDGTIVLKPKFKVFNPWKSNFYQNYDFSNDMKNDPNTRPLNTKLGSKYNDD